MEPRHEIKETTGVEQEVERKLGWISLTDIRIDDWWVKGTTNELPRFGVEMLGKDF